MSMFSCSAWLCGNVCSAAVTSALSCMVSTTVAAAVVASWLGSSAGAAAAGTSAAASTGGSLTSVGASAATAGGGCGSSLAGLSEIDGDFCGGDFLSRAGFSRPAYIPPACAWLDGVCGDTPALESSMDFLLLGGLLFSSSCCFFSGVILFRSRSSSFCVSSRVKLRFWFAESRARSVRRSSVTKSRSGGKMLTSQCRMRSLPTEVEPSETNAIRPSGCDSVSANSSGREETTQTHISVAWSKITGMPGHSSRSNSKAQSRGTSPLVAAACDCLSQPASRTCLAPTATMSL
mmetsp:Transcript_63770/g.152051  ORF Transcript_63770/g.152051 Transcript_63770/m.152051 type:complete len:291 (+) Transcript_63770:291-1163(+)